MKLKSFKDYHKKRIEKNPEEYKNYDKEYNEFLEDYNIGVLLKQFRTEAGLTQTELANKINSSKNAISRIENHCKDIKISTFRKILNATGHKLDLSSLITNI